MSKSHEKNHLFSQNIFNKIANQIFFPPHGVKLFLFEKSPTHNNVAPKLNAGGQ